MVAKINITAAGAVDREFFDILTPSGLFQSSPRPSQSCSRASRSSPRGPLCLQRSLEPILGGVRALKCDAGALKQDFGNCSRQPADGDYVVAWTAVQDHPTTRAGGQDDVS